MARIEQDELGEMLSAYVDGELNAEQRRLVEQLLGEDETARQLLAELRATVGAVASLPRHAAPASIAFEIQGALERSALLEDGRELPAAMPRARRSWKAGLAMAAVLGLAVVTGWFVVGPQRGLESNRRQTFDDAAGPVASSAPAERREDASGVASRTAIRGERSRPSSTAMTATESGALMKPVATVAEKLASGADAAMLQLHPFQVESVRLQLQVADESELQATSSRIVSRLAQEQLADLGTDRSPSSKQVGSTEGFYLRGKNGVNFEAAKESQVLVRATPRQISRVLDELSEGGYANEAVSMSAGSLEVKGLDKSQAVIGALADAPARPAPAEAPTSPSPVAPSAKDADGFRWLQELLLAVGVEPELVNSGGTPEGEKADASLSAAEPGAVAAAPREAGPSGEREAPPAAPVATSLVERRLRDLPRSADDSKAKKEADESDALDASEPYVTLVIQVVQAPPDSTPAKRGVRAKPAPPKPTETREVN